MLKEGDWNLKDEKWKSVWKLPGPQRVRFFIWTALQERLLSNVERVRRGLAVDPSCTICGFHLEDILHILRDCAVAKDDTSMVHEEGSSWACLFGLLIWRLWKNCSFKPPIEEESFEDLIFLNTDGAVQLESKNVAPGGVVRDGNGDWIFGYNRRFGKCSIFNAELLGILEGLRLIQRRGHDEVIIQSDSLEAVKTILEITSTEANSTLIRRIQ
ncbi:hypothetical protein Godav_023538, partial [Gossypium davidsonii]|nr:hypothetical protein [Gossypium davidsonii]